MNFFRQLFKINPFSSFADVTDGQTQLSLYFLRHAKKDAQKLAENFAMIIIPISKRILQFNANIFI
jgi:hypothetical protein